MPLLPEKWHINLAGDAVEKRSYNFRGEIGDKTKKGRVMTAPSPDSNLLSAGRGDAGVLVATPAGTVCQTTVVTELREAEQRLMKKIHPLQNMLLEHPGTKKGVVPPAPLMTHSPLRKG